MNLKDKFYNKLRKKILAENNQEFIKLNEIWITGKFEKNKVGKKKMKQKEQYFKKYHFLKETIIINQYNELVDGYTSYLIAIENGIKGVYVTRILEKDEYYIND